MKRDSGFTLIEVLVAIAVMAVVMVGFTSMGVTTIRADAQSQRQSTAVTLAQAKLEDLRVLPRSHAYWTTGLHTEATVEAEGGEYTRAWDVETDYKTYKGLSRVTVTVSWEDNTAGS